MLRIRADDPSALCQLGVKFGCTVEEGKKLLLRAREMSWLSWELGEGGMKLVKLVKWCQVY